MELANGDITDDAARQIEITGTALVGIRVDDIELQRDGAEAINLLTLGINGSDEWLSGQFLAVDVHDIPQNFRQAKRQNSSQALTANDCSTRWVTKVDGQLCPVRMLAWPILF